MPLSENEQKRLTKLADTGIPSVWQIVSEASPLNADARSDWSTPISRARREIDSINEMRDRQGLSKLDWSPWLRMIGIRPPVDVKD